MSNRNRQCLVNTIESLSATMRIGNVKKSVKNQLLLTNYYYYPLVHIPICFYCIIFYNTHRLEFANERIAYLDESLKVMRHEKQCDANAFGAILNKSKYILVEKILERNRLQAINC